jgi:hypothetical protein
MAARPRSTWPPAITRLQDRLADLEAEAETASVDDLPMVRRELAETAARLDAAKVRAMAEAPA